VSGRTEQLARQIRKLRTSAAEPARTLQRAVHLALDLAAEALESEDGTGDFPALAGRGVIDADVAQRLAALAAIEKLSARDYSPAALIDLDVFLRSVEAGAPARAVDLPPLSGEHPKFPPGTQKTSTNVSGRVLTLVGRDGRAFILCDEKPIGQPFDLPSVPMSAPEIERGKDGSVALLWEGFIRLTIGADFASVRVEPE
jgi:hypothetical protein